MSSTSDLKKRLSSGALNPLFQYLYCTDEQGAAAQTNRYLQAVDRFCSLYGEGREVMLFSAPGRTEIGGNHTDHQQGRVLAASVNLDVIAVVSPNTQQRITMKSEGFKMDSIAVNDREPKPGETGSSAALIRGCCAGFADRGLAVCGFDAYTTSNVLKGSGLSSSAAFEVLVGTILSHLCNHGTVNPLTIAQIAQFAENRYFGKPCGLMDQTASAAGGFITIDFENPETPILRQVPYRLADSRHHLVIVDTGGNHTDLTHDYAQVTKEMQAVAHYFGKERLRQVDSTLFYQQLAKVRAATGDRAVLRAMHFFEDNQLVEQEEQALSAGDFEGFKKLVNQSGLSSALQLQNLYSTSEPQQQGVTLALALARRLLEGRGAWRVHGGGFAGTIQAFVPHELTHPFMEAMENLFGAGSAHLLAVRPVGAIRVDNFELRGATNG